MSDDDEEWPDDEPETVVTECERCGKVRPCQMVVDPFVVEGIRDALAVEELWCRPCFEQRADDV